MTRFLLIAILMTSFFLESVFAEDEFPLQLSFTTGTTSTSFSETQSSLKPSDGSTATTEAPYSGSSSILPFDLALEYYVTPKRSYFVDGGGPLVASGTDRLFYVNAGMNFYLGQLGTPMKAVSDKLVLSVIPKVRYYLGIHAGTSYLIYSTKSQTKSDLIFGIGAHGGGIYSLNTRWGLKGEAGMTKGTGALVSSMTMKILLGVTYSTNL